MLLGFKKFLGRWCAYLWLGGGHLFRIGFTKKGSGGSSGISSNINHRGWRHWAFGGSTSASFEPYGWNLSFGINLFTLQWRLDFMLGFERPEYKEYMRKQKNV